MDLQYNRFWELGGRAKQVCEHAGLPDQRCRNCHRVPAQYVCMSVGGRQHPVCCCYTWSDACARPRTRTTRPRHSESGRQCAVATRPGSCFMRLHTAARREPFGECLRMNCGGADVLASTSLPAARCLLHTTLFSKDLRLGARRPGASLQVPGTAVALGGAASAYHHRTVASPLCAIRS